MKVALVEFLAEYLFDFKNNHSIDRKYFCNFLNIIFHQLEANLLSQIVIDPLQTYSKLIAYETDGFFEVIILGYEW